MRPEERDHHHREAGPEDEVERRVNIQDPGGLAEAAEPGEPGEQDAARAIRRAVQRDLDLRIAEQRIQRELGVMLAIEPPAVKRAHVFWGGAERGEAAL